MSTVVLTPAAAHVQPSKLRPKEHGAYAILAIPIVTSLVVAGPSVVGLCVAISAITGFLAHEPLLVTIGHRGARAKRTSPAAFGRLLLLLGVTVGCGGLAMAIGPADVRYALLGCALLATASFSLAIAGKHRTPGGQLAGVTGLSVPCVPILLAGDVAAGDVIQFWGTWLIGFTATTMAVRGVIAAQKRQSRWIPWSTVAGLTVLVALLTFATQRLPIATLPMLVMAWYLLSDPPPAMRLKRVGWTLVTGTVATAIWMIAVA